MSLNVGLIGTGFMGRMHSSVYTLLPNANLVGVYDANPDRATQHAEQFGLKAFATLDELYAECDTVDICLPTYLHKDATIHALEAGKHVVCEKPMALRVEDADAMMAAQKASGKRLFIAHCIRFWPEYALLKQIAVDGRLGKLLSLNLTRYGEFPHWGSNNWLADESLAGGGALDMHIHDTDYALYILGEPTSISSFGTVDHRGVSQIFTTFDYGHAVAHIEGGWNLPPNTPFKMAFRAIFEGGAAIMDGGPMTIYRADGTVEAPQFEAMAATGGGNISDLGGYFHELKYFVDRTLSGEPFEVSSPETSRESLRVVLEEIAQAKQKSQTQ